MRSRLLFSALLPLALTGCAVLPTATTPASSGAALQGTVHGGQQPVVGAHVYLLAAPSTGYQNASVSLLAAGSTGLSDSVGAYVVTDANGRFSISGDYTCTSGTQVYLYVVGGNAGAGNNSFIGEMAVLGSCPATGTFAATVPLINVSEVTTVAAAYAMAGFALDATHISSGTSALAKTGLANAFANAANLASITTGVATPVTTGANGTVPVSLINTIADILAACINSTGPSSAPCQTVFLNARSLGNSGAGASDMATAAINIAHNPGINVSTLTSLVTPAAPFQPTMAAPTDFTIGINYSGGGLNQPYTIAIDAGGNAWTANGNGNGVSKFSPLGVALSGVTGFTAPSSGLANAVSIDSAGNAWAVSGNGLVTKFSNAGVVLSGAGFNAPGAGTLLGVSIDGNQNAWLANFNNPSGIDALTNAGAQLGTATQPFTAGGINGPIATAIDPQNNIWVANYNGSSISKLNNAGTAISTSNGYTGGGLSKPNFIAIDSGTNVWTANSTNNSISKFSSAGAAVSPSSGYTGGGLNSPSGIAIDGNNIVWVSNANGGASAFNNGGLAISPSGGYLGGAPNGPQGVAVDPSGNVWMPNNNTNTMTELIGAAAPTVTPLATAISTATLGQRP